MTTQQEQALGSTKSLFRSSSVVASMTVSSRILGFVRDLIIAQLFGASGGVDAFIVAFRLPNFFRGLFAEGAFSQAFIPVLSEYQEKKSHDEVKQFLNHVAGNLSMVLFFLVVAIICFAPFVIDLFAPGFSGDAPRNDMAVYMLRITFPYILPISLVALAGSILNCHGNFSVPAFTPVFLNISIIAAAYFLSPHLTLPIYALAWGVFTAGLVQMLFQIPFLYRIDRLPKPKINWGDDGVKRILTLLVPAVFAVSVSQINVLIDSVFASYLPVGSVSWLYFSDRLTLFPLAVFGLAISTVILPHLSRKHASESKEEFSHALDWGIRSVLLIGLPAGIGLFCLAGPTMSTLFQYGKFTVHDVEMSLQSLRAFSIAVPFFMLVKVLVSAFFAQQDIRTPSRIAIAALIFNVILNFLLVRQFAHVGLALATALASYLNVGLLLFYLLKRKMFIPRPGLPIFYAQIFIAAVFMSGLLLWITPDLNVWAEWKPYERFFHLTLLIGSSSLLYFGTLHLLKLKFREFIGPSGAE